MKKIATILLFSLVAACTCCTGPTTENVHDLQVIKTAYVAASNFEEQYCAQRPRYCNAVRTAHYDAAAALMTAESEPTNSSIAQARKAIAKFLESEQQ